MGRAQHSPFVVIGGGIGGLGAALALARRGRRVRVLERATTFGEIGAGLQLAPNASCALDDLDILAAIHVTAVFPQRIQWMDARSGEHLTALDLGAPFVERYGYPYVVMHRSDLLAALLDACRAHPNVEALETAKVVVALDDRGDGVDVRCADGSVYAADVAIGADGLWSLVRAQIANDGDPICSEYVAYRGAIPIADVSHHAGLDNVVLWTGPGMHLVQYPLRRGELYNQVAVFKSSRYRPDTDDWGTPDELDERFAGSTGLVVAALAKIRRNRRWPMFDRLPIRRWTAGRVTLLGDAAHPMLQYLAQGAAQALEDAIVLGNAFAAHDDPDAALRAYETARSERTGRVQTLARAWGDLWHDGAPGRNPAITARAPDDFSATDWFYGYRAPSPAHVGASPH